MAATPPAWCNPLALGAPLFPLALLTPVLTPDLPSPAAPDAPPKGPSNLRLRVIWGAIAAAGLFGCTFAGPVTFGLFFAAVQAVMLKEFYRIMRASGYRPASWSGGILGVLLFAAFHGFIYHVYYQRLLHLNTSALPGYEQLLWLGLLLVFGLMLLVVMLILREIMLWPNHGSPFANIGATLSGLLYVSLPMSLLNVTALSPTFIPNTYYPKQVFLLIFLIWAADTGAYFAGKNFCKHKLAPSISPGKTWEGWMGGALLTLVVGWAAGYFVPDISLGHRLVAAGVVAVFGPLGDLAESMLKRSAGVKDSGTFLPGHGGLLDRFDAFLLVLPVLALLQVLAG